MNGPSDVTIDLMTIADKYNLKALFNRCDFYIAQALRSCQLTGEDVKVNFSLLQFSTISHHLLKFKIFMSNFKIKQFYEPEFNKVKTVPVNFVVVTVLTYYSIYYEIYWNSLYV